MLPVGMWGGTVTWGDNLAVSYKVTRTLTVRPSNPAPGIYLRRMPVSSQRLTRETAALFMIAPNWKQPKCLPTGHFVHHTL